MEVVLPMENCAADAFAAEAVNINGKNKSEKTPKK